jgi:hypothetical protein
MTDERPTRTVAAHGMTWCTLAEFAAAIPLLDIERCRQAQALSPQELVKDNPVRTVIRFPNPQDPDGPGLYVKRYKFRGLRDRLKHLIVPTKPVVEWRIGRALERAGIRTCEVLAIAVRRRGLLPVEGFLVSREIPDATNLKQFLRKRLAPMEQLKPGYRREVTEELAALTAALADGAFHHCDYHAGNLLVRPDAPPGERIYVVDLHRIGRRLGRRQLLHMLGMLASSTNARGVSHDDRIAFLRAFLMRWKGGPGAGEEECKRWARDVKAAEAALRRRGVQSRTRRCMVRSSLFTIDGADSFVIHRRRDFPVQAAMRAIRLHGAAIAGDESAGEVLRRGTRTEVTICRSEAVPPFGGGRPARPEQVKPGQVCAKSFRRVSLWEKLKDALRPRSRARAAWIASHGCSVRGVPAARPLALLEARWKWSGQPDYLIMEALENDGTLGELASRGPSESQRRALAKAVAELLNVMACAEVYHPDSKPNNLLIKETDPPYGGFSLWLVDLDRMRFDVPMTRRRWVKCLARLNSGLPAQITLLDRIRCLRECGRWTAHERHRIARDVYVLSLRRRPAWLDQAG